MGWCNMHEQKTYPAVNAKNLAYKERKGGFDERDKFKTLQSQLHIFETCM